MLCFVRRNISRQQLLMAFEFLKWQNVCLKSNMAKGHPPTFSHQSLKQQLNLANASSICHGRPECEKKIAPTLEPLEI